MQPFEADSAALPATTRLHLALADIADEIVGTLARLLAYVGTLALFAILGLAALGQLPALRGDEAPTKLGWSVADRSHPAFAVSQIDSSDKTEPYTILRHPEGGRRDVIRWAGDMAELAIYRTGGEFDPTRSVIPDMADRMGLGQLVSLEEAGTIDTKFGPITLFRPTGTARPASSCLGYLKRVEQPALLISGWSCQGDTLPARRAAIACTLNRLTLLTSGNEPKLAGLFAQAELKRRTCGPLGPADWVNGAANAQLRGSL
ncbi:hypothetical protein JQ596_04040 [Bradyrhizobium manausense]|uniref:hypothetical protein n=1 Tax=Bradyrhizobium manausense TaxID=989370 RepID=UPI001BAE02B5|nr:hypothetical protein [Bradyrhizobium manausense]MBR0824697.1 hypothetical protein [Bradyrhizobium manausense]